MAETIPPCINMIILGFVANLSIGGLFLAGIAPAILMATALAAFSIWRGKKVDASTVFEHPRPLPKLIGGALVGLVMIVMIGKGVASGVATSTEISAFAVVYAIVVGWLAFRELTWKSLVKLFVDSSTMAGMIMFIVAAASSVAYSLTIEQMPHALARDHGRRSRTIWQLAVHADHGRCADPVRRRARRRAGADHLRPAADADRRAARLPPAALRASCW